MGLFLIFCRIHLKFCSWLYKKRWHTLWKFQLEITSNKEVIAKKPLTNLYEMNSRSKLLTNVDNNSSILTASSQLVKIVVWFFKNRNFLFEIVFENMFTIFSYLSTMHRSVLQLTWCISNFVKHFVLNSQMLAKFNSQAQGNNFNLQPFSQSKLKSMIHYL